MQIAGHEHDGLQVSWNELIFWMARGLQERKGSPKVQSQQQFRKLLTRGSFCGVVADVTRYT